MIDKMMCRKTRGLSSTLRALADFNDLFCYHQFVEEQFERTLMERGRASPAAMLQDAFPNSDKAGRINLRMDEMEDLGRGMEDVACGAMLMASVETAGQYLKGLAETRCWRGSGASRPTDFGPEEWVQALFEHLGAERPATEIFDTLIYWRLRRNKFVHLVREPTSRLENEWGQRGTALTRYWTRRDIPYDFPRILDGGVRSGTVLIAIRQIRACLTQIDEIAAPQLQVELVLRELDTELEARADHLRGPNNLGRRALKIVTLAEREYGLPCEATFVERILQERG